MAAGSSSRLLVGGCRWEGGKSERFYAAEPSGIGDGGRHNEEVGGRWGRRWPIRHFPRRSMPPDPRGRGPEAVDLALPVPLHTACSARLAASRLWKKRMRGGGGRLREREMAAEA
uniref:Uncharacterized protein n=1 Tax=Leersia perrieri TaxID=77586 RepID=A0A0D9XRJ0_9ORYZ